MACHLSLNLEELTRCFLFRRITLETLENRTTNTSLCKSPLCHTRSNALDISKKFLYWKFPLWFKIHDWCWYHLDELTQFYNNIHSAHIFFHFACFFDIYGFECRTTELENKLSVKHISFLPYPACNDQDVWWVFVVQIVYGLIIVTKLWKEIEYMPKYHILIRNNSNWDLNVDHVYLSLV